MEKFVFNWLIASIGSKLDWNQFGGQKGNSVAHYLIEFINFVQYNQDLRNIQATLATFIDFSKAFNRQDHNVLITLLCDLGTPGWLLNIVVGFLENRCLTVSYKDEKSTLLQLPGGGPQGTILGLLLFLILINEAGLRTAQSRIGEMATSSHRHREIMNERHWKFVDDMTIAKALDLKRDLEHKIDLPRPLNYRDRTSHVLRKEKQQDMNNTLTGLQQYAVEHKMLINQTKSKAMLFNTSQKYDFLPSIQFDSSCTLEVVEQYKLLGVIITSNLSWQAHVDYICSNAFKRMWMLRRLKQLGAREDDLLTVYRTQIRCVLEFSAPVWNPSLTKAQIGQIERPRHPPLCYPTLVM